MKGEELVIGATYFMVTYPDPSLLTPVVISYRYLGKDLGDPEEESPQYYFRYLPAFQEEGAEPELGWRAAFPELFRGWGADVPTSFAESKLEGFVTIDGLLSELSELRDRLHQGRP